MFWLGNRAFRHGDANFEHLRRFSCTCRDVSPSSQSVDCCSSYILSCILSFSLAYWLEMLNAIKKWAKGGNEDSKLSTPMGVRAMGQALQRKFARGIQYNSKLVLFYSNWNAL